MQANHLPPGGGGSDRLDDYWGGRGCSFAFSTHFDLCIHCCSLGLAELALTSNYLSLMCLPVMLHFGFQRLYGMFMLAVVLYLVSNLNDLLGSMVSKWPAQQRVSLGFFVCQ